MEPCSSTGFNTILLTRIIDINLKRILLTGINLRGILLGRIQLSTEMTEIFKMICRMIVLT